MNVLFETQLAITSVEGRLHAFQGNARLDVEPLLRPVAEMDGRRVQVGTVLRDQGMFRMWYLCEPAWAASGPPRGKYRVAYAESDDGLAWRRPAVGLVKDGPAGNNYIDLNVSAVFVDPTAPAGWRYRGTVYAPKPAGAHDDPQGLAGGFYTAHSADGLRWELDVRAPRWHSGDTITCAYHPGRGRGLAAMKFVRLAGGLHRRAIWTAELADGAWGDPVCALVPDEFDDLSARARGFQSTDFYKMGLLPAGCGWVGLIENFRHWLPMSATPPQHYAIFGNADVTLAYQAQPGDRWLQAPGRPSFIGAERPAWAGGWLGVAGGPVEAGAEHWLYVAGSARSHAWEFNPDWTRDPRRVAARDAEGAGVVAGLARWPRWRLFGFQSEPAGVMEIDLGALDRPSELVLNYKAGSQGMLQVQLFARAGRGDKAAINGRSEPEACVPMTGDTLAGAVLWKDGARVDPVPGKRLVARIVMDDAALYAWEWRPAC